MKSMARRPSGGAAGRPAEVGRAESNGPRCAGNAVQKPPVSELESPKLNTAANLLQVPALDTAGEAEAEAQHSAVATRSSSRAAPMALGASVRGIEPICYVL
jgi:hypothetical protein